MSGQWDVGVETGDGRNGDAVRTEMPKRGPLRRGDRRLGVRHELARGAPGSERDTGENEMADGREAGERDEAAEGGERAERGGTAGGSDDMVDLPERETPWIETRAGGLFFVNAVLVAPELIVLIPLGAGAVLRGLGLLEGPSRFIDTIPQVAAYVLPWTGWVLVVPLWTTLRNLRMDGVGPRARRALSAMAGLHLLFLAYTVWRWITG